MDLFRQLAFFTIARDASFVALAASTLMLAFSFHPPLALLIGANVAFLFCVGLSFRALWLNDERIVKTEAWRVLERDERPVGDEGLHLACDTLKDLLLRGARAAAVAAIVLSSSSLFLTLARPVTHQALAGGPHALQAAAVR